MLVQILTWIASVASVLGIAVMVLTEVIDIVHHPEYKNPSSYTLVCVWGLISLGCAATAAYYSAQVAVGHSWYRGTAETIVAFALAGYGSYKLYKTTSFHITGVDYDVALGRSKPRA